MTKTNHKKNWLALVLFLDQKIKPTNSMYMLMTVLQKGSVYALAAVSMNLLNGYTGLFSLGHAGFMLIGAYAYAIFTIPAASRDTVYQYYDAAVRVSFPEVFSAALGPTGTVLGIILAVLVAGLAAALFAYLIGLPVLKLKSDYLAIATLVEQARSYHQWLQHPQELPTDQHFQVQARRRDHQTLYLCPCADSNHLYCPDCPSGQFYLRPFLQGHTG